MRGTAGLFQSSQATCNTKPLRQLLRYSIGDHLCTAELEAQESFYFYKDIANREKSPRIYSEALNHLYRWTFQFNHAALHFIRGQCKDLGLKVQEE